MLFSATSWLTDMGLQTEVARVLLSGQAPSREEDREKLLRLSGSVSSEEELAEKLRDGRLAEKLAALVFPALRELTSGRGARPMVVPPRRILPSLPPVETSSRLSRASSELAFEMVAPFVAASDQSAADGWKRHLRQTCDRLLLQVGQTRLRVSPNPSRP